MFEVIRIGFHPAAYDQPEEDKSRETLTHFEWGDLRTTSDDAMPKAVTMGTKLHTIVLLLRQFAQMNDHTVIFTQSLAVLKVLAHVLTSSHFPFLDWVGCIEGKTGEIERVQLVQRFQQSNRYTSFIPGRLRVLLLSMGVGGVGLTLTAANRAILCDVSWNPMKDAQAVGRIFRLGQTKKVFVYRLVCGGTLEECIQSLQRQKGNLVTTVSALMSEGSSATFDTETFFQVEKKHYFDEAKYAAIQSSSLNISASEIDPQLHAVIKSAHSLISCVCNFQQEEGVDCDSDGGESDVSLGLESASSRFFFNQRPSQVSLYASLILFLYVSNA
jgi:superfamily II DNA or RNA helicase